MEFAGYTTRDAVLRLRDAKELRKMFEFAIDMSDIIEDKQNYFGIFAKKPEKVRVLPGLEAVFKDFLHAVAASKQPARAEVIPQAIALKRKKPSTIPVTCETLVDQMLQWCEKKGHDGHGKVRIEKSPPNKYCFTCIYSEKIVLTVTRNGVSLSNVQRHIKDVCWMAEKSPNPERPKKSSIIQKFFPLKANSNNGKPVFHANNPRNNQSSTQGTMLSASNFETSIPLASASSSSASDLSSFEVTVDMSDNVSDNISDYESSKN